MPPFLTANLAGPSLQKIHTQSQNSVDRRVRSMTASVLAIHADDVFSSQNGRLKNYSCITQNSVLLKIPVMKTKNLQKTVVDNVQLEKLILVTSHAQNDVNNFKTYKKN